MPLGSPGMESDVKHPYTVNLVASDGSISEYARHNQGDAAPRTLTERRNGASRERRVPPDPA
jgi:hypothetical protein